MAPDRVAGDQARALVLLVATGAASFAWPLFHDKPRAGAAFGALLGLVLFALLKGGASRLLSLVCTWGIVTQSAGLACVIGYERLSSKDIGVCDEATGLPVGLCFGVALLVVAAEFLRGSEP